MDILDKEEIEFQENVNLAPFTSWRVGGLASKYLKPSDISDIQKALKATPKDEPVFWLGLGSNVLIRDTGFSGLVIHMHRFNDQIEIESETEDYIDIKVGAGVSCAKISKFASKNNLSQAEFFSGIPGTMGGALAMNAGAFGGETWELAYKALIITRDGELKELSKSDFDISYRSVSCKYKNYAFLHGLLRLSKETSSEDLNKTKELLKKRNSSQPIGSYSCGSVFKNPEGLYAAQLIESSKLKGVRIGGAKVSSKHANFILNDGNASSSDIEALITHVKKTVFHYHGVNLETEVRVIGEKSESV